MNILFWVPPWPVNGDPNFFRNTVRKHLVPQANTASAFAKEIDFVIPEYFSNEADKLNHNIRTIKLPLDFSANLGNLNSQSYTDFYTRSAPDFEQEVADKLSEFLSDNYDIILLWETPVPFLEKMFPHAVIIHQMPGVFSRPPYPHTVTFDPIGLYRGGALQNFSHEFQTGKHLDETDLRLTRTFNSNVRQMINQLQPIQASMIANSQAWEKIELLPLQVSGHYAFQADTAYENQLDFALDVMRKTSPNTAVIATQYITSLTKDAPLNKEMANAISRKYPNFFYHPEFDSIDCVSQYILPFVSGVITASSSLGFQVMAWNKEVRVVSPTFIEKYDVNSVPLREIPWNERCQNTVGTILNRHQPLASSVTQDGNFLFNVLKDMKSRKDSGKMGIDLMSEFSDIDKNYPDKLLSEFRYGPAAKNIGNQDPVWNENHRILNNLRKVIAESETRAVSFDVFDTLICRPFEKPADLFQFLEVKALELTGGITVDFGRIRTMCEIEARASCEGDDNEITIYDIYKKVSEYYCITHEQVKKLIAAELDFEVSIARERRIGRKLFDVARESGKPIYLISDMYLPSDVISRMLDNTGYREYEKLFVSVDYGKRKWDGSLYDIVSTELGIRHNHFVHIGDNKRTDKEMPESKKFRTYRWASAIERMRVNPLYKEIYSPRIGAGEKARSAVAGITAMGMFDGPGPKIELETLTGGRPENLGFAIMGPLIAGYMMWLGREARRDGISDLYFMSREGWVLKEAFTILHANNKDMPDCHYLYGSRRALRIANCQKKSEVLALTAEPFDPGVALDSLLEDRFAFELDKEKLEFLLSKGIRGDKKTLERTFEDRQLLMSVVNLFSDEILENAKIERAAYKKYVENKGFFDAVKPGIVDIGWKANIQGVLGQITQTNLVGYYYATLQNSEKWVARGDKHRCFLGQSLSPDLARSSILGNRHLVEYLFCHTDPSLLSMVNKRGKIYPVFRMEENSSVRRNFIGTVHDGALRFVQLFTENFENMMDQIYIDPNLAEAAFQSFAEKPNGEDAKLLVGHIFEDAVGGLRKKYIINPNANSSSASSEWKKGMEAVLRVNENTNQKKKLIEKTIVKIFANERKYLKYRRDRHLFFMDSQKKWARSYYQLSDGNIA